MRVKTIVIDLTDSDIESAVLTLETKVNAFCLEQEQRSFRIKSVNSFTAWSTYSTLGEPGDYREYHHGDRALVAVITFE